MPTRIPTTAASRPSTSTTTATRIGRATPTTRQVGLAGLSAVGVAYGFARYGPGLFAPQLRREFELSVAQLGLVTSAAYVGYLVALLLVGALVLRVGARPLILAGGLSAAVGMALVTVATTPLVLVCGLVIAGMSSGWVWAPFSDAVDQLVAPAARSRVLGVVAAGTAFGVALAGPLALLAADDGWRIAWLSFVLGAVAVTGYNAWVLRHRPLRTAGPARRRAGPGWLLRRPAVPLMLSALSYGLVGAAYWAFAVETITPVGSAGTTATPVFWTVIGLTGTTAVLTGTVIECIGLRRTHMLLFAGLAAAVALLAVAGAGLAFVLASAVLYGPAFMAISGLLAVWSYRIYPERPTAGFSATVFFLGIGAIVGPAVFGAVAQRYELPTTLAAAAALALLTLAARPRRGLSASAA